MSNNGKSHFALGLLLTGAIAGAGATLIAVFKKQRREQIYREAEIKAMDELDDLIAEDEDLCDCNAQCDSCAEAENCDNTDIQMNLTDTEK